MNPIDYWYQKYLKEKLTWRDIKTICDLYEQMVPMTEWDVIENEQKYPTDESFYSAILNKVQKKK